MTKPRVTFAVIVLNGEPFTRYCLRQIYPFAHQIVVVEGAVARAMGQARPDGHSRDGTLEALYAFKEREDPGHKLTIVSRDGPWAGKDTMCRAAAERTTGDYFWQVDIDEFYRDRDMALVLELLADDPGLTAAAFRQRSFFAAPDFESGSSYLLAGGDVFRRLFRFAPGSRYVSPWPPTVVDVAGLDQFAVRPLPTESLDRLDVRLFHYSLLFPKQVIEKTAYYAAWDIPRGKALPDWAEKHYLGLADPFNLYTANDQPGWITPYDGDHPSQAQALWDDARRGRLDVAPYPAAGRKKLARLSVSPDYRRRIRVLTDELARREPGERHMPLDDPFFVKRVREQVDGLRLAVVNQFDTCGGAARTAFSLAQALNAGPDDASYLVWKNKRRDYWIETVPANADGSAPDGAAAKAGLPGYDLTGAFVWPTRPAMARAELINCHDLHAGYAHPFAAAFWSLGKPLVWTLHDMQAVTGNCAHAFACDKWRTGCGDCPDLSIYPGLALDTTDRLWRDKQAAGQVLDAHVVVPSRWLADVVEKSFLGHLPVTVIPNGIDTAVFAPRDRAAARARLGLPRDGVVLSFCANGGLADAWKGGGHLLAALSRLVPRFPKLSLLNIGGDLAGTGLPVVNLPHSDDDDALAQAYAASDVFAYPSQADTFGLAMLKAMCCGLPVACLGVGALPELAKDGETALVAPPGDDDAFVSALARLIADAPLRARLGAAAAARGRAYDVATMAGRYRDLFVRVLAERTARPAKVRREITRRQRAAAPRLLQALDAAGNAVGGQALAAALDRLPA
ncbi:MAG: glycosyltransferase [Solidesulfovibrio magneticus str. Maddingley MBC34]|uniref:Glycosyltransferase n=1 Tax=Solidesulfovibrio magneticus str. Maddingley MBC34 TaxID=1206767 RepID=K6GH51_9BACT|nr:MAG: glycosyltransferase [Solidesulfovibrio magneticus str. Maddingley MBC34]